MPIVSSLDRVSWFDSTVHGRFPARPTIHVLVVVDATVSLAQSNSFGISRVIRLLRAGTSYANFELTLAVRPYLTGDLHVDHGPMDPVTAPEIPRYSGFRFDGRRTDGSAVLAGVEQVWCFGFEPGNDGSTDDAHIGASASAASTAELKVLAAWQNAGGSMLAMGDHHYLGASLCARMLRVGSMRRWSNADAVPTIAGFTRIDTNQPMNTAQKPVSQGGSGAVIPFEAQGDAIPQPLYVRRFGSGAFGPTRPHPLLCGGKLGLIDVYPDHPHEGRVREDHEINTLATWSVDASIAEYPSVAGVRPVPQVIAWGQTMADPPYNEEKGPEQALRYPILGAYDGEAAGVGRIVVDSTWHHWFDINLVGDSGVGGFEHAADLTVWHKLVQFYTNVAVWLASPAKRTAMLNYVAFWATFQPALVEELGPSVEISAIGRAGLSTLQSHIPDCMLRSWISDHLRVLNAQRFKEPQPPWPCLSCPPTPLLEELAFGELLLLHVPARDAFNAYRWSRGKTPLPEITSPERALAHVRRATGARYAAWLDGESAAVSAALKHVLTALRHDAQ